MTGTRNVFLIGAGFIGSEILYLLLDEGYPVTTLVRRPDHAEELKKLGVTCVAGTLSDEELITEQVTKSDIVIHTATADDLPSVRAVLNGIKRRASNGQSTIYLHTSGASLLGDYSEGKFRSDKIYQDNHPEDIDNLADDAPHREVDLNIVAARRELGEKAKVAIIIPPLIYGYTERTKRLSIQLPTLARFAIKNGFAGHVGQGLGVWGQIHVLDLARAYLTILHHLESDKSTDIFTNPYFFIENGKELSWRDTAVEMAKTLHSAGKVSDPEPKEIPKELYSDIFGDYTPHVVGTNARNRANRLRALGWEAREKDTLASLSEDEIPVILQDKQPWTGYGGAVASGK